MSREEGMRKGRDKWREQMERDHLARVRDRELTQEQRERQARPDDYAPRHTFLEDEDELLPLHLEGSARERPAPLVGYQFNTKGW